MQRAFDLNLRHLRAIALIAKRGSMGVAAEAASLSQPALAQGLAKVERQLGVSLFVRRPQGMLATNEGIALTNRIDVATMHLASAARLAGGPRGFGRTDQLMTSTQLRAFLALVDHGSFAAAARAEGWAQPAVHRAVRDLELLAAAPLIERQGRGVVLTKTGRAFARSVRLAAIEIEAGIADTRPDGRLHGRLRIGAMPLCRAKLLPTALTEMLKIAPAAAVEVIEGSWRELIEPLRDGIIDFMVGALREGALDELVQWPLFEDRLAIVARVGHPILGSTPDRADLTRFPWIVGHPGSPLRSHWEELFGVERPPSPVECGSVMTIRGILLESDCLTLLSPAQIEFEMRNGLLAAIEPPERPIARTIGVTSRRGLRPTALQSCFLEAIGRASISNTNGEGGNPIGGGVRASAIPTPWQRQPPS